MAEPEAGRDVCVTCEEVFGPGEKAVATIVIGAGGSGRAAWLHVECQVLGIVGHEFGVCSCSGFDRSRAAALVLRDRIRASWGG